MLIFRFKVHFKHYYGCHSRGHFSHCYCGFSPTNICQDVRFFDWICTKYGAIHKWRHQFFLTLWSFPLQCSHLFTSIHHNYFSSIFYPISPKKWWCHLWKAPMCRVSSIHSLVDTYTGASIIDMTFVLQTLIPWPLYKVLWQITGKKV